jgi:hypothetical protein
MHPSIGRVIVAERQVAALRRAADNRLASPAGYEVDRGRRIPIRQRGRPAIPVPGFIDP